MPRQQLHSTATITPAAAQLDGTSPDLTLAKAWRTMIAGPRKRPTTKAENTENSPVPLAPKRTGSRGHGPIGRRGEARPR